MVLLRKKQEWHQHRHKSLLTIRQEVAQTASDKKRRAQKKIEDAPKKAKKGVKGLIKKAAQKVVDRMSEELSIDDQMKISKEYNRMSPEEKKKANKKALGTIKKVKREKDKEQMLRND